MSTRNGHRPPRRRATSDDVVLLAPSWPQLPSGTYDGTALEVEVAQAPWAARKRRVGEAEKRRDWHVYVRIRLEAARSADGQRELAAYRAAHAGAAPETYLACRFARVHATDPIQPGRTSKLYRLLLLVAGTRLLGEIRLQTLVGRRFRVQVRTVDTETTETGRKQPRAPERRYSVVHDVIAVLAPQTPTSNQQPATKHQPTAPIAGRNQAVTDSHALSAAGRASRRRQSASHATAPAAVGSPIPVGADAESTRQRLDSEPAPALVEVDPWTL